MMKVPPPGNYSFGSSIPIEGSVAGDVFSFRDLRGVYSGELTVGGDDMVGQIQGQWVLPLCSPALADSVITISGTFGDFSASSLGPPPSLAQGLIFEIRGVVQAA